MGRQVGKISPENGNFSRYIIYAPNFHKSATWSICFVFHMYTLLFIIYVDFSLREGNCERGGWGLNGLCATLTGCVSVKGHLKV